MAKIDQIVCYFGISSGADASRRFVQFVTPNTGWKGFVDTQLKPVADLGVRRFLLWMPHGREAQGRQQLMGNRWVTTNLRYDAYALSRQNPAFNWFTQGFAEAIYPITRQGIEVITYVGTLHGAPEFDALPAGQAKWEGMKAIAPLLDARCSIAFDTSIYSKPGHYVYDLAQSLKQAGYKYYIEPTPHVDSPHWFSSSCVVSDAQWTAVTNPGNQYILAAPSKLSGEILRGWFGTKPSLYPTFREWYNWTVPPALAQGHSCCLALPMYFRFGGTIDSLIR
ncbi:MAG: hypothetical protein JNG90_01040 [Planctomycetaceae bacterium]|nr:hypothetical protein [Planctomycetaceae bacterium]